MTELELWKEYEEELRHMIMYNYPQFPMDEYEDIEKLYDRYHFKPNSDKLKDLYFFILEIKDDKIHFSSRKLWSGKWQVWEKINDKLVLVHDGGWIS